MLLYKEKYKKLLIFRLCKFLLKYKKLFKLELESSIFPKYKKLFTFRARKATSWNTRNFFQDFRFLKFKKSFLLRKYKFFPGFRFLIYKNSFLLRKYKKCFNVRNFLGVNFFYFSGLRWKVQGSISGNTRKAFFWKNIRFF